MHQVKGCTKKVTKALKVKSSKGANLGQRVYFKTLNCFATPFIKNIAQYILK